MPAHVYPIIVYVPVLVIVKDVAFYMYLHILKSILGSLGYLPCFIIAFSNAVCAASSSVAAKQEELEPLYSSIPRVIIDGLTNYEK